MSEARTKKERFLPWAWKRFGLTFEVLEVRLDGARAVLVDHERRLVELEEAWQRAEVRVRVSVLEEVFEETLGAADDSVSVVVALRCDDTRWRSGSRLAFSRAQPSMELLLPLERDHLAGHLELTAHLVRDADAHPAVPGRAARAHARLAGSRPWELRIDRKRTLGGVYLDVRYRSFGADPSIPEALRKNLWQLEMELEAPILWVNSDHKDAVAVLDAKGYVGARAALRDVAYDVFVPVVWLQLFLRAATTLQKLGEPGAPWQDSVLDAVSRLLFPAEKLTADARERLEAELEDLPQLVNRLDGALQAEFELAKHLLRLVEEVS